MKLSLIPFLIALIIGGTLAAPVFGDAESEAADCIRMRLSQVDALKANGQIGETATGFLAERAMLGPRQSSMVAAENEDRRIIYQSVASRTGQSAEDVGTQRALQIATRARSGVWLQKPSGEWYQKP